MRHLGGFSLSFQKSGFSLVKRENPASPAGAQGELPEGQERVPWGMTVTRNSLVWWLQTTLANLDV